MYHPQFTSCIITYSTYLEAKAAVKMFNCTAVLERLLQSVLANYADPDDAKIAKTAHELLFVEHLNSVLRVCMYPSRRLYSF